MTYGTTYIFVWSSVSHGTQRVCGRSDVWVRQQRYSVRDAETGELNLFAHALNNTVTLTQSSARCLGEQHRIGYNRVHCYGLAS